MQRQCLRVLAVALVLAACVLGPARGDPPPTGWKGEDINGASGGKTDVTGQGAAAVWTVTALGEDIWGSADAFHFAYTSLPGDGGVTARLLEQTGGHDDGWAKTGTMLRESTAGDSMAAYLVYCNGPDAKKDPGDAAQGRNFEPAFRVATGETPRRAAGNAFANRALDSHEYYRRLEGRPIWMRTQRQGQTYTHMLSDDGKVWQITSQDTVPIDPKKAILAGLCACSHAGDVPVVMKCDNVGVGPEVVPSGPANVTAYPGNGAVLLTFNTLPNAVGYNIYRQGPKDAVPQKLNADPVTYGGWFIDDKGPTNGTVYRYLVVGVLQDAAGKQIETSCSQLALAEPQAPLQGLPGFYSHEIGTETPGSTKLDGDTLTITGSGADINGQADGFRYVAVSMSGNYSLTALLLEKPAHGPGNASGWAKAGVMIRESLDASSRMGLMFDSSGNGTRFERRRGYRMSGDTPVGDDPAYAGDSGTDNDSTTYPIWLRITRVGDTVTGFQSTDGTNFTQVGTGTIPNFSQTTLAGLAVTAVNNRLYGIGKFRASTITIVPR